MLGQWDVSGLWEESLYLSAADPSELTGQGGNQLSFSNCWQTSETSEELRRVGEGAQARSPKGQKEAFPSTRLPSSRCWALPGLGLGRPGLSHWEWIGLALSSSQQNHLGWIWKVWEKYGKSERQTAHRGKEAISLQLIKMQTYETCVTERFQAAVELWPASFDVACFLSACCSHQTLEGIWRHSPLLQA